MRLGASAELSERRPPCSGELAAALLVVRRRGARARADRRDGAARRAHAARHPAGRGARRTRAARARRASTRSIAACSSAARPRPPTPPSRRPRSCSPSSAPNPPANSPRADSRCPTRSGSPSRAASALEALPRLFHRADEAGLRRARRRRSGSSPTSARSGRSRVAAARWRRLAAVLARPHPGAAARARRPPQRDPHRDRPARRRALVLPGRRALDRRGPRPAASATPSRSGSPVAGEPDRVGPPGARRRHRPGRAACSPRTSRRRSTRSTCSTTSRSCRPARSSPPSTRGSAGSPTSRAATSPRRTASARHP